jgi:class 3 adenylate cyclase/tetratricopeptide (TPR) repeat protein
MSLDVDAWLSRIGLGQYAGTFRANGIDFGVLLDLTDQDFEKLGVVLGHRRKLLRAIADLEAVEKTAVSGPAAVHAAPRPMDIAERRQLTIMFCDLAGSTALSTRLDPEDLREVISAYQRCCADLIAKTGGFVARYVGDGVLVYFGYPQALEHDAERAVRAGLSLVEAVPKLKTAAGVALQVRVGIATGLVVVGDLIGTGMAREHEVVGETPNLAARLQARAEPGTVLISSSTRGLTGGLFDYRDLGAAALKGFAEAVPAWQVLGASAAESRFEALRASTTPLVNRSEEIDLLLRRWERAKTGEGSVVLISGDPGIGKSRIAETVIERVSGEPHARLREFCSPHHQDIALYPSLTQLERAAGFRREDTDDQRLTKLEAVLAMAADDVGEAVPVLASLLSISTGERYSALDISPQRRKAATLQALVSQIVGLTKRQPLLLVVEDAHWADPTSLELFELIVARASSLPLLAIVTFRPEFVPPWVGRSQVTLISLNRLPRRLCAEMIAHVTGSKVLPQMISNQINDRTDGVPLFIEELTKAVIESGLHVNTDDRHGTKGSVTPVAIPTSLQESLLARLDRLAPTTDVVQIAAALGRQFSHELISAVAALTPEQLDDALAQLVNAELIFRRGVPPDAVYTFKHALVQDTAYGTLLRGRRQQIHARIADTLENQFPDIVAAQPALLARHCSEAGLSDKAVVYWLKAGQQALAHSAMTEAAAQLRKGLDALDGLPDGPGRRQKELDLQLALGLALLATKGYSAPEVGQTYARARMLAEQAEQINQPEYLRELFYGQWVFHRVRSEHRLALALAEQMEKIGDARNNVTLQMLGRRTTGTTHLFLGNFAAGRTVLERCLDDPSYRDEERPPADPQVMMLAYLAWILATMGYIDQAQSRLNEALSEARRPDHPHKLADLLLAAIPVERVTGSPRMQQHIEELLVLATERGLPLNLGWATAYRGASLVALGQAQEGLSLITEALTAIRATGAITGTPDLLMLIAGACAKLGRPGDGLNCLAEAAEIIEATDERWNEAGLHRLRGDLLDATGDLAGAELSYRQAIAVARLQNAKLFELRASTSLARLMCKQHRDAEARDVLAPTYDWFTEGFDAPDLKEARALLDALR